MELKMTEKTKDIFMKNSIEKTSSFSFLIVLAETTLAVWIFIANYFLFEYLFDLGDGYFREIILPLMVALTMTLLELMAYGYFTGKLKIKIIFESN